MLPSLNVLLSLIFVAWCVAAVMAFGHWVMLLYPAIWACIGIAFFGISKCLKKHEAQPE